MFLTSWATTSTYPPREVTNIGKAQLYGGDFLSCRRGKRPHADLLLVYLAQAHHFPPTSPLASRSSKPEAPMEI